MKNTIKRFILISGLILGVSTSGQSQVEYSCMNSCFESYSGCNTYARLEWVTCWAGCTFNWGSKSWEYEYDLSHNYYSDTYCDFYLDSCLDGCDSTS